MYFINHYVIDWDKVQTLEDMKRIISTINISFEPNTPNLENIKDLVREEPKGKPMAIMD